MTIRKMTGADYDQIYALWLSCAGMGLNDVDDSREGFGRFLRRNPDTCFVSEEDGIIVGVIMAGSDGRRGYIYHTAVCEGYRRRGVASRLVKAVEVAMAEIGIHKIALVAFERNRSGNEFWEAQGYTLRTDLSYRNKALTEMTRIDT